MTDQERDHSGIPEGFSSQAVPDGLRLAFSTRRSGYIGTGHTRRRTVMKVFWYAEQLDAVRFALWMLNKNNVPTGKREVVEKDKLLSDYHPELEYYTEHVQPQVEQLNEHIGRGDACRAEKDYACAEREYGKALGMDEKNVHSLYGLTLTYLKSGDSAKAESLLPHLMHLDASFDPEHKHLFNELGIELRKRGMYDSARHYYGRAIELAADDEHLHFNMARVLYEQSDWSGCVEHLRKSLAINPGFEESQKFFEHLKTVVDESQLAEKTGLDSIAEQLEHAGISPGQMYGRLLGAGPSGSTKGGQGQQKKRGSSLGHIDDDVLRVDIDPDSSDD
jgi:tetratricopeptide (TPR) repeat protein